jgi:peptide/nickel transport system substrate-binding protein
MENEDRGRQPGAAYLDAAQRVRRVDVNGGDGKSMTRSLQTAAIGLAVASVFAAAPAVAQKSKDTVRAISEQPISLVDSIYDPQPATTLMTRVVFDGLVEYDVANREYKPALARSWEQIDDTTLEFKLRTDVKFHDGSKFDAEDVVYTINYLIDPKNTFRFKDSRYGWIDSVEKVDDYTVRVKSKTVFAPALSRLSLSGQIYPSDAHAKAPKEFGKNPIGTGPFKVVSVSAEKGVVMERNGDYKLASSWRRPANVSRVEITSVPERQAQVARLLAGEIDFLFNVQTDQAQALAADPRFNVTVKESPSFAYMQFDTADRSGVGVFKDQRVRKALSMAVNREGIKKAMTLKEAHNIPLPGGVCDKWLIGCDYSASPPKYDPAAAKKLLTEAGYPNGFELELTSWGAVKEIAEAVAGDLRKIGVRARVDHVVYPTYAKKRREGKLPTLISYYDNAGGQPDIEATMSFFYIASERDYIQDPVLHEATAKGAATRDLEGRKAIYRAALDRVIEQNYLMPLIALPAVVVHAKDLVLYDDHKSPEGFVYTHMQWKK